VFLSQIPVSDHYIVVHQAPLPATWSVRTERSSARSAVVLGPPSFRTNNLGLSQHRARQHRASHGDSLRRWTRRSLRGSPCIRPLHFWFPQGAGEFDGWSGIFRSDRPSHREMHVGHAYNKLDVHSATHPGIPGWVAAPTPIERIAQHRHVGQLDDRKSVGMRGSDPHGQNHESAELR
jgi:hypothetical protein